jgi:hypothetical protein
MAFDIKPQRGSERVKAWVYAILNPVIESLRRETLLLKTGNLSWRVRSRRLEYVRPISDLVDGSQLPNLEDFLAEHPSFVDRFRQHDSALGTVEHATTEYALGLLKAPGFGKLVDDCLTDYESRMSSNPLYPDLREIPGKLSEHIAEFIANDCKSLPRHYTLYHFWKEYEARFEDYFGGIKETQHYNVRGKTRDLLDISERLTADLENLRLTLVREYDIPAAPIETTRGLQLENASPRTQ